MCVCVEWDSEEYPKRSRLRPVFSARHRPLEILEGVACSPFGAVRKDQEDIAMDARVIHDLSFFPPGISVNDHTNDTPKYRSLAMELRP